VTKSSHAKNKYYMFTVYENLGRMFTCHEIVYKKLSRMFNCHEYCLQKVRQEVYLPRFSSPLSISYTEKQTKKVEKGVSIIFEVKK
jgi:hypothetical protein